LEGLFIHKDAIVGGAMEKEQLTHFLDNFIMVLDKEGITNVRFNTKEQDL